MNILITAGPTREPIDPVRFISNRSSGRMGVALAEAALARGHAVRLVTGPIAVPAPPAAERVAVVTAQDMLAAVQANLDWSDALIMSAAVADWRPRTPSPLKLKKNRMPAQLEMERTPDILQAVAARKGGRVFVGFAAETGEPEEEARRKLQAKRLDLIVANDVSRADAGFEVDTNRVTLLAADGTVEALPLMLKTEVASRILDWVEAHAGFRA
ncbi:MAG: hypothetical protein JXR37_17910 [Kiritimatiellae bacterium]|nr:hypothetical protein [Kiritimatiellia bacterium]